MSSRTAADTIASADPYHRWCVRVAPADAPALEELLALQLPKAPVQSIQTGIDAALRLGPDEWLLLMGPGSAHAFRERSRSFGRITVPDASVVEVTHRSVAFEIRGSHARWILNSGCPLDLSDAAFPPGACTRTLYAKVEVVLWRRPDVHAAYYLECWRSYAPYLSNRLTRASAECAAGGLAAKRPLHA